MRQFFRLGLALIAGIYAACLSSLQAQEEKSALPLVILIGDSIRVGYQAGVTKALAGKAVVWSPSENCKSSEYTRENLTKWLDGRRPTLVHINVGLHDLVFTAPDKNFVSAEMYRENIAAIAKELGQIPGVRIIWATTTPVRDELLKAARSAKTKDARRVAWRENQQVLRYNDALRQALHSPGIVLNDLYSVVHQQNDPDLYIEDGVHFSIYGREFLSAAVAKSIAAELEKK